jgi:GT2 family glycosyltransferase
VRACIRNIDQADYPDFEIIIVGSDERLKKTVANSHIKYVHEKGSKGLAAARNMGIRASEGAIVVFIDDDCAPVGRHWIWRIVEDFENDELAAGVGGLDLTPVGASFYEKSVGFIEGSRKKKTVLRSAHKLSVPAAYKRKVLLSIGGFDEGFRYAAEDIDIGSRLRKVGYRLVLDQEIAVYHQRRNSLKAYWKQFFNFGRAHIRLFRKHPILFLKTGEFLPPLIIPLVLVLVFLTIVTPFFVPLTIVLGICLLYICAFILKIALHYGRESLRYLPLVAVNLVAKNVAMGAGFYAGLVKCIKRQ